MVWEFIKGIFEFLVSKEILVPVIFIVLALLFDIFVLIPLVEKRDGEPRVNVIELLSKDMYT